MLLRKKTSDVPTLLFPDEATCSMLRPRRKYRRTKAEGVMAPVRKPLFYGWWIAIAAALGCGLGPPPILVFSFPIFLKAFANEFHASRSLIALAFSLHNIVSAFAAPFAGRLIDRIGVRKVVLPATLLFGALLIGNRFITVSVLGIY